MESNVSSSPKYLTLDEVLALKPINNTPKENNTTEPKLLSLEEVMALPKNNIVPSTQSIEQPKERASHANRLLHRGTEALFGGPGDIANLPYSLGKYAYEKYTGKESGLPEEIPFIPTSSSLRKRHQEYAKEKLGNENYYEPETPFQEYFDRATQITTGLASGSGIGKGLPIAKSIVSGLLTAGTGKIAESLGLPKAAQIGSEVVTNIALNRYLPNNNIKYLPKQAQKFLISPISSENPATIGSILGETLNGSLNPEGQSLQSYAENLYKNLETLPDYTKEINAKSFHDKVVKAFDNIKKIGHKSEGSKFALEELKIAANKSDTGFITAGNAIKSIKELNKINTELYKKDIYSTPLKNLISDYKELVKNSKEVGKEFKNQLVEADGIWSGMNHTSKITHALEKMSKNPTINKLIGTGIGGAGLGFLFGGAKGAILAPATQYGISKASDFLDSIYKNPIMQKHYKRMINGVLKNNVPIVARELKAIDQRLKKDDTSDIYKLFTSDTSQNNFIKEKLKRYE